MLKKKPVLARRLKSHYLLFMCYLMIFFSIMYVFIFKLLALNLELVFLILSVVSSLFF